jgi:hypothetical protein
MGKVTDVRPTQGAHSTHAGASLQSRQRILTLLPNHMTVNERAGWRACGGEQGNCHMVVNQRAGWRACGVKSKAVVTPPVAVQHNDGEHISQQHEAGPPGDVSHPHFWFSAGSQQRSQHLNMTAGAACMRLKPQVCSRWLTGSEWLREAG